MSIFDVCVKVTSSFEGTEYGTVTNNFDGQGISLGLLQWNLGTGSLQTYILNHIDPMMFDFFPKPILPLIKMPPSDAVTWVKDVCMDENGDLKEEWRKAFERFLTTPSVINVQKQAIDKYWHRSKEILGKFNGMKQTRKLHAWCFDLAVQSWSLGVDVPAPHKDHAESIINQYDAKNAVEWNTVLLSEEQQILIIMSHLRALKCKPEWRRDFFNRKATIAMGFGIVHGKKYDFRKLFMES